MRIKKSVWRNSNYLELSVPEFIQLLQDKLATIPEKYHPSTYLEVSEDSDRGSDSRIVALGYSYEESPEEEKARGMLERPYKFKAVYESIDRYRKVSKFRTIKGLEAFLIKCVGHTEF